MIAAMQEGGPLAPEPWGSFLRDLGIFAVGIFLGFGWGIIAMLAYFGVKP